MKHVQIPVAFRLKLFASEPDVRHPVAMTRSERGRLYVLITQDYPNERQKEGGNDYTLVCEDTNADGKADRFTCFAEKLSINWIWSCAGYSGFSGKLLQIDSLRFGQTFFCFRPDGSRLKWMTTTSSNTRGFGFNEARDVFGSTANNAHGWYMAIPRRYLASPGRDNGSRSTGTHKDFKPITSKSPASKCVWGLHTGSRAWQAPLPVLVGYLRQADRLEPVARYSLLKGVAEGCNYRRRETVPAAGRAYLLGLQTAHPAPQQPLVPRLLRGWGILEEGKADPDAQVIHIKAVQEALKFDKPVLNVRAGKQVVVEFGNPDAMQHNIVIGRPGSLEKIGAAADTMITAADGAARNYVPLLPEVLAASPLVVPETPFRLTLRAPVIPGDYPFLCTFPGHWRSMNRVMKVSP